MNYLLAVSASFIILTTVSANEKGKADYARASDFAKKLHARVDQLQAQAQAQDSKRREEVAMLRRELRQAHAKMETSIRQKDVNETSELENAIKRSIRQENVGKDLKEIIHSEIDNYLTVNKICVSGSIFFEPERDDRKQVVKFGYTFKRRPSLTMAISRISGNIKFDGQDSFLSAGFDEIYKSYAHAYITDQVQGLEALNAYWMACL